MTIFHNQPLLYQTFMMTMFHSQPLLYQTFRMSISHNQPLLYQTSGWPCSTASPLYIKHSGWPYSTTSPLYIKHSGWPYSTTSPLYIKHSGWPYSTTSPLYIKHSGWPYSSQPFSSDTLTITMFHNKSLFKRKGNVCFNNTLQHWAPFQLKTFWMVMIYSKLILCQMCAVLRTEVLNSSSLQSLLKHLHFPPQSGSAGPHLCICSCGYTHHATIFCSYQSTCGCAKVISPSLTFP